MTKKKKKETLDFLAGSSIEGVYNNETTKAEKLEEKIEEEPEEKPIVKKPKIKKEVREDATHSSKEITTTIRIRKTLLKQVMLIFDDEAKTSEVTEKVFSEFVQKNKKILAKKIEEEIEKLRSAI